MNLPCLSLAAAILACGVTLRAAENPAGAPAVNLGILRDPEVVELFRGMPVQDAGRVKPLDTVARFTLLRFSGKQTIAATDTGSTRGGMGQPAPEPLKDPATGKPVLDEKGKPVRLSAIEWLLVSWFRPELAKEFRVFTVDNSDAVTLLGLQGKGKRDRYSYNEISPARETLGQRTEELRTMNPDAYSPEQRALAKLAADFMDYTLILSHMEFALIPFGDEAKTMPAELLADWQGSGGRIGIFLPKMIAYIRAHPEAGAPMSNPWLGKFYTRARLGALMSLNPAASLRNFAPEDKSNEVWSGPGTIIASAFGGEKLADSDLVQLDRYGDIARAGANDQAFKSAAKAFVESSAKAAAARGDGRFVGLEVGYHKTEYFYQALLYFFGALIVVALGWLAPRGAWGRWCSRIGAALMVVGAGYSVTGIVVRCIIMQRPPVTNLYETIIFIATAAVVFGLVAEWITRKGIALAMASLAGTAGMFLSIRFMNMESTDTMRQLEAVLITTFWLATHVPIINLGYAAGMVAAILSMFYFTLRFLVLARVLKADRTAHPSAIQGFRFAVFKRPAEPKTGPDRDLIQFKDLNRITYAFVCAGLFLSLVGTVLGGIWANYSWGRFWGWDPKENGALMIVLMNLVILHARVGGYIREVGLHAFSVVLGMITVFSWFGTNQLGIGLHSYGQLGGVWWWIYAFWASQGALLLFALFLTWWDRRHKRDDLAAPAPVPQAG